MRFEKARQIERMALGKQQLPGDRQHRRPDDCLRVVEDRP